MAIPVGEAPLIELLGFCAGTIISLSALPRIRDIIRHHHVAAAESIPRNLMLATGNLLWVVYGIATSSLAVAVMCAVAALLNGLVLAFAISARRVRQA